MGEPKIGIHPQIYISIADGPNIGYLYEKFEWASFTNGGYIIRVKLLDSYWNILKKFATDFYLQKGRQGPTRVVFEVFWPGVPNGTTGKQLAYMADLDASGINSGGVLEFIAIDPPSYWLNAGDAAGKVYTGKVSDVIKKVVQEYFIAPNGGGDVEVSETKDSNQNQWWMMRQDPKTFIGSLIDWSASITEQQTNWIVSSGGSIKDQPSIWIKEQAKMQSQYYGLYILDTNTPGANNSYNFEFLADNIISVFQKQIITSGISSVSERFFDRKMDEARKIVHVYDDNTAAKKNVNIDTKHGFVKPGWNPSQEKPHEWSTHIMAIPQHNDEHQKNLSQQ